MVWEPIKPAPPVTRIFKLSSPFSVVAAELTERAKACLAFIRNPSVRQQAAQKDL
jgi:hypothetical protein